MTANNESARADKNLQTCIELLAIIDAHKEENEQLKKDLQQANNYAKWASEQIAEKNQELNQLRADNARLEATVSELDSMSSNAQVRYQEMYERCLNLERKNTELATDNAHQQQMLEAMGKFNNSLRTEWQNDNDWDAEANNGVGDPPV